MEVVVVLIRVKKVVGVEVLEQIHHRQDRLDGVHLVLVDLV